MLRRPAVWTARPRRIAERISQVATRGADAFVDTYGSGYVDLAIRLGVAPSHINTIIDIGALFEHGVKFSGTSDAASTTTLRTAARGSFLSCRERALLCRAANSIA